MDRRIGFAETVGDTTTFYYYLTDHVGTEEVEGSLIPERESRVK